MRKLRSKEGKYWGPEISPEEFEERAIGSIKMDKASAKDGLSKGLKSSEAIVRTKEKTMEEVEDKLQKSARSWKDEEWAEYTVKYRANLFNALKEFQPYDPANPDSEHYFARGIRQQFAELLLKKGEIEDIESDFDRVKFYTVSKVADLDRACGIDGILEYTDKKGKVRIVTFDLTTNKDKEKGYFADIVILDKRLHEPTAEATRKDLLQYVEDQEAAAKAKRGEVRDKKIYRDEFIQKLDAFAKLAYSRMKPVEESFQENFKKHDLFIKIKKMAGEIPHFLSDPTRIGDLVQEMKKLVDQLPPYAKEQVLKIIKERLS